MPKNFPVAVDNLIRKAPAGWLVSVCEILHNMPSTANVEFVLQRIPTTNNADLSYLMNQVLHLASGKLSWEALAWSLDTSFTIFTRRQAEQNIELLWGGPSPADRIPARRIDQSLYDLIASAKREILLVTFAAAKIDRLAQALHAAAKRGITIKLILEFEEASEGQLSFDALKAFPKSLIDLLEVYFWPVEKRERNQAGRPGKLHAKAALIDDTALISSANLTDDAFNRNLELGALFTGGEVVSSLRAYLDALMSSNVLKRWKPA